ncbi:RNA-BINDING (RRM/RBD/RNP MOTIFS) FAMILY PROTEIN-RELATED [Salix purpurea]|uniref:RNA-BINDING (RRM/RBD/RNP MOTIFS) FAMILY PROTEIN-RELATED n=1 Tax=Salix purpurea TaxID=77065 RepID=A0A9Q0URS1_SALPP|nr:RNA-BINDING (RRM/RBD/RNP MOTIFS) FAMILY PROTEIN-RELATED [Salix purpurea]
MAATMDMSLDDIIKKNRERGRGRGRASRGRGRGPARSFNNGRMSGPVRRGPLSVNARPSKYSTAKPSRRVRSLPWQHDLLEDSIRAAGITGVEVGTKIYVSNLDYGVTNEDIRVQLKLYVFIIDALAPLKFCIQEEVMHLASGAYFSSNECYWSKWKEEENVCYDTWIRWWKRCCCE